MTLVVDRGIDRAELVRIREVWGPELVQYCVLLAQRGLNGGLDGNLSRRVYLDRSGRGTDCAPGAGTGEWIVLSTPSGMRKESLVPNDLVITDHRGRELLSGSGPPTSEMAMHLGIYHTRSDSYAVIHAHPPYSVALTMARVDLGAVWLPETLFSIGRVGVADYQPPTTPGAARVVEELMGEHNVVVLPRHGTVAVGACMEQAYSRTEAMEHASRIIALAMAAAPGSITPLSLEQVDELHRLVCSR